MDNLTKKRLVAIFIGVVMLASVAEVALLRTQPAGTTTQVQVPTVVNRKLTLNEMRSVLSGGNAIIEYFHNEACDNCTARETMYQDFVKGINTDRSYVMLSYGVSENETSDWMIDLQGTQIDLSNISDATGMKKLLCRSDVATLKPNICVLEELE
jgi:hypothetical protein